MKPTVFNHSQYTDLEADYMILKAENEKLKQQLTEYDEIAAEYGIDGKTMLTLAKSQIETARDNARLREALAASQCRADAAVEMLPRDCGNCKYALYSGACKLIPDGDEFSPDYTEGFDRDNCGRWQWRGPQAVEGERNEQI